MARSWKLMPDKKTYENPNSLNEGVENDHDKNIQDDTLDDYLDELDDAEDIDNEFKKKEGETEEEFKERIYALEKKNKQLFERAKKAEEKLKELKSLLANQQPEEKQKQKEEQSKAVVTPEDLDRVYLEAKGYASEEVEIISKAAKVLGKSIKEAAEDEIVKLKIEKLREEKRVQEATPRPSGSGGVKDTHSVDYYIEKGIMPEDEEMQEKVWEELARRSKSS